MSIWKRKLPVQRVPVHGRVAVGGTDMGSTGKVSKYVQQIHDSQVHALSESWHVNVVREAVIRQVPNRPRVPEVPQLRHTGAP